MQNGKDGVSADSKYTWVKYSKNADGSNLTDDPTGAIYIGIAYNMDSEEESNNPQDYLWTKIKGDDGESGADAYTIILGNENVSFAVEHESNIALSNQSYSSTIQVIQGVEERSDFTIGSISSSNGINVSKNDTDKTIILSVQKGDLITSDSGYFRIPISIDGLIFYKDITWSVAKQGMSGQNGQPAINVSIGNEGQNIPCDSNGLVLQGFLIEIPFTGYEGFNKVSCSVVVGSLPTGITLGSNTPSTSSSDGLVVLNVAKGSNLGNDELVQDNIQLTFSINNQEIIKYFTWVKTKDGADGDVGEFILYGLNASSPSLSKTFDNKLDPESITFSAYSINGDGNNRSDYNGMFIIQESTNGITYDTKYTSENNESSVIYTPSSIDIKSIKCLLYKADSITSLLDIYTVPILTDVDNIRPVIEEISTTLNGVETKVDAVEKSITDKVWQTDITTQINNYDNTTTKIIRDRVTQVEQDIDGITSSVSDIESSFNGDIQELTTKISQVEQDANGFKTTVEQSYAKKDDLENEATSIRSEISQTASEINQSISDLEGNTSKISQDLSSLTTRVTNTEGDVTELKQTASGLETTVKNNSGDIATLKQTAQGLQSDVSTIQENVGKLETSVSQNAEQISLTASTLKEDYYNKMETDSKIQLESDRITSTVSDTVTDHISNIKIGGRNLLQNSTGNLGDLSNWNFSEKSDCEVELGSGFGDVNGITLVVNSKKDEKIYVTQGDNDGRFNYIVNNSNKDFTISGYYRINDNLVFTSDNEESIFISFRIIWDDDSYSDSPFINLSTNVTSNEWTYFEVTQSLIYDGSKKIKNSYFYFGFEANTIGSLSLCLIKFENGNKATTWTPAPEDLASLYDIDNLSSSLDQTNEQIIINKSEIEQLSNSISMLVTDDNGQSMMTQTSDGWTFNIGTLQTQINDATEALLGVESNLNKTSSLLNETNSLINDVSSKVAYVNMTTDDSGAPCLELGKQDNPFKLRITNTSIDFMQDNIRIAYITNRQLYIQSSVVTDEMKIGETSGFIWKKRLNGNMGLRWVGE